MSAGPRRQNLGTESAGAGSKADPEGQEELIFLAWTACVETVGGSVGRRHAPRRRSCRPEVQQIAKNVQRIPSRTFSWMPEGLCRPRKTLERLRMRRAGAEAPYDYTYRSLVPRLGLDARVRPLTVARGLTVKSSMKEHRTQVEQRPRKYI